MLRSMTGYGQAEVDTERFTIKAEFKSLNNKFLEINLRMPKVWHSKDHEVRKELTKLIERGSCQVNINVQFKRAEDKVMPVNKDVAAYYIKELTQVCNASGLNPQMLASTLLQMPNLFQPIEDENNEDDVKTLLHVVNLAFTEFEKFRQKEGEMLANELIRMTQAIMHLVKEIETLEPERMQTIRGRIDAELSQLKVDNLDKNRLEQELIYYIEKLDISEEKTRLIQHCTYFLETMKTKSAGKKLGFIAQEMGREINTIGSKANHFKIQQRVVEMKDELEKIKEQINNIV
jgi:uncharacterized protein (TIGR00255 family)